MIVPNRGGGGPARNRVGDGATASPAPKPKRAGAAPGKNGRPKPRPAGRAADPNRTTVAPVVDEEDDFSISAPVPHVPAGGGRRGDADDADDFSVAATRAADEPADEPPDEPGADGIPTRLGGYEVLKVLGKGGMGSVLLGRQISLNRKVALKVMRPEIAQNPAFVARFTREAYAAAQLTHHNVVQIYDIGEDKGQHFFSMEFVHGRSLMDLLQDQGRIGPEAAVGYTLQAARGLRQGHNQGMVHRDVKPANLLVNGEGIVKVADLGLVKLPSDGATGGADLSALAGGGAELTGAGMAVGTPAFMAPEQATGSAAVDARADVYSLGCTLYALVTGRPPFAGASAPEVMSKHLTEPVVPPEALVKRVPGALSAILMKMLAKDADERYQSMDEVIAALEGFLGMPRSGAFDPSDHETEQLDRLTAEFQAQSSAGRKRALGIGFLVACAAGIVLAAAVGKPVAAVKALFLLGLVPVAYFVVHGLLTGGVVFARARALAFGMRLFDWLMVLAGAGFLLGTLYLFGLHVVWVKLCLLSGLLAFYLWLLTDRVQEEGLREPLRNARLLCRMLRGQGLSEEQLREFVCKHGGPAWEPFFEALFGYEAKLAARALRAGGAAGPWKRHAAWREPVVAWADARLEARRQAREQRYLQRLEVKALQAQGVGRAEAEERAAAVAAALVDGAAEARKARTAGKQADLRGMMRAARTGKPRPGYNLAGKRLRDLWLRDLLNDWFGRRLRFALGALLLAAGLQWMFQNQLLTDKNPIVEQVSGGQVVLAVTTLSEPTGKPLGIVGLPAKPVDVVDSYRAPIAGACLLFSAVFLFGWRSSVPSVAGAVVAVAGPALGVPDTGVMSPAMLSLGAGTLLILVGGWLLRK